MRYDEIKQLAEKYIYNGIHFHHHGLYIFDNEMLKEFFNSIETYTTSGLLVKTKDILVRDNQKYEVVIADDNIFVVCLVVYDEKEKSDIVKYDKAEIYANQSSINTLEELRFEKCKY